MSRSTDENVVAYVREKMPKRVREALADAKYDLYYGPGGGGGMGWVKASKIVEEWWDEEMRDDLVVDDAGNVSTKHDFDRYLDQVADEREREALQEAIDEGIESEEAEWIDGTYQTPAEAQAKREAQSYVDGETERAMVYDERDVRRLVLGKDWP